MINQTTASQYSKKPPSSQSVCYLCDLDTPVEQPLWTELVLAVSDVFQQRAVRVELGDDLQVVSRTDAQDPHNVGVVQAAQSHHVLHRGRVIEHNAVANLLLFDLHEDLKL